MMLDETFDLLGDRIVLAHGKDLKHSADIEFTYAGNGIMDFPYFIELLRKGAYSGPLILHGMCEEAEFTKAVENISLFFPEWEKECTYEE